MSDRDPIYCRVQRQLVERGDSAWMALQFDPQNMSEAGLRMSRERIVWCFDGYDDDQAELYVIPAVRRFLADWRKRQATWLYFGSITNGHLRAMYAALLSDLTVVRRDPAGKCQINYDRSELGRLVAADLEVADQLAVRIGLSPAERLQRALWLAHTLGSAEGVT